MSKSKRGGSYGHSPNQVEERVLCEHDALRDPFGRLLCKGVCDAGTNRGHQDDSQDNGRDGGRKVIYNCTAGEKDGIVMASLVAVSVSI